MKKIKRESLKKAEKGSGVYTMGSVYKLPDTWTPTFDLSNHEKVSARNDYAEKPLKKVVEEIVERKQRFELIRPGQFYFDACYNPSKTAFLKNAEKKGCKILNGLGMSSSRGLLRSNYGPDRRLHWM